MSIEHRWATRQPAALPVSLTCRSLGPLRGHLRNISSGGALVQVSAALPPNSPVEIVLPVRLGSGGRSCRLTAIVTRSGKDGVGLMFDRVSPDTWVALLSHLGSAGETAAAVNEPVVRSVSA